jgi:hypothetical protein
VTDPTPTTTSSNAQPSPGGPLARDPAHARGLDLSQLSLAVRLKRRLEGLTVDDVGAVLELAPATIRRAEAGQLIDLVSFVVVARWLQLPADELLGLAPDR